MFRTKPPGTFGLPLWARARSVASASDLLPHLEVLSRAHPSPVVGAIVGQLQPGQWQASRSAISSLRREGSKALVAVPAVLAWLMLSDPRVRDQGHQYALREAMNGLADWRRMAGQLVPGAEGDVVGALRRLSDIMDGEGEAIAIKLLSPPHSRAVRGACHFLRGATGDHEAAVAALSRYLEGPAPPGDDGDLAYTRAEAISALQELGARLVDEALASAAGPSQDAPPLGSPSSSSPGTAGAVPKIEPENFVEEQLLPLLLRKLEQGPLPVRRAAMSGLLRLGRLAGPAKPALWRLCNLQSAGRDGWEQLEQEAMRQLVELTLQELAPDSEVERPEPAEGLAKVLAMARDDPDPQVRAAAVGALGEVPAGTSGVLEVVLRALDDDQPAVRAVALRVWGGLL